MEELITYNTAVLSREKGFFCEATMRPTQSVLARWIREKHGIDIEVKKGVNHYFAISGAGSDDLILKEEYIIRTGIKVKFETWEEAMESGLQEALKLIPAQ